MMSPADTFTSYNLWQHLMHINSIFGYLKTALIKKTKTKTETILIWKQLRLSALTWVHLRQCLHQAVLVKLLILRNHLMFPSAAVLIKWATLSSKMCPVCRVGEQLQVLYFMIALNLFAVLMHCCGIIFDSVAKTRFYKATIIAVEAKVLSLAQNRDKEMIVTLSLPSDSFCLFIATNIIRVQHW